MGTKTQQREILIVVSVHPAANVICERVDSKRQGQQTHHLRTTTKIIIKILGSRATGKLAATRTSPETKSGTKSGPNSSLRTKSGTKSGPNSSRGSKSGINHSTGGIQSSMIQSPTKSRPNTSTGGIQKSPVQAQSSLVLAILIKELKAYRYSAVV
jgi:hypothetical protein